MSIFGEKPIIELGVGDFEFKYFYRENDLRRTRLEISCPSGTFSVTVGGNTHTYGYLLEAARQQNTDALHGYAVMVYFTAMSLTQSDAFCGDVRHSVEKHMRRLDREAQRASGTVGEYENLAAEALMSRIVEDLSTNPAKAREAWQEEVKNELLNGD